MVCLAYRALEINLMDYEKEYLAWEACLKYMLSDGDSDVIRCREGGGPEDLMMSLVMTLAKTRKHRDSWRNAYDRILGYR